MDHEGAELLDSLERPKAPSALAGQCLFGQGEGGSISHDIIQSRGLSCGSNACATEGLLSTPAGGYD